MKRTLILFLVTSLLYSCEYMETVIDVEIPPHEPVLVLNGILDTDTTISVLLSHSVGAFEQNIPSCIIDAQVLLFENNQFIDTLSIDLVNTDSVNFYDDKGSHQIPINYYKSSIIPTSGNIYKIVVNHPNYNSIQASTYIPLDISVNDILVDTTTFTDKIRVNFSFNDQGGQRNYYRMKLFANCMKSWFDEYYNDTIEYAWSGYVEMMSNDPSFPAGIPFDGYTFIGNEVIFTDALFNGQEKQISIDVVSEGYRYDDCDTIGIKLSTFSDDTYDYYNSLGDHIDKGDLGLFGGETVPVFSNVENGLGVLISVNAQLILITP